MTTPAALPSSSLRRRLSLAAAALALLGAVACDDEPPKKLSMRQEMQAAYKIDTHDSSQVGGAVASGETLGNKEAGEGLTVLSVTRREEHEMFGIYALEGRDWSQAIKEFQEALRWNKPPTPKPKQDAGIVDTVSEAFGGAARVAGPGDPATSGRIRKRLGVAYAEKGDKAGAAEAYLAAARDFGRAALATKDRSKQNWFLFQAATSYEEAGRRDLACERYRRAARLDDPDLPVQVPSWCP